MNVLNTYTTILTETKKGEYEKSMLKAFKPMLDLLEALLKGAKPFIMILTVVVVTFELLKCYHSFHRGSNFQLHITKVMSIIFCATLALTAQSWLLPILKKIAGV